MWYPQRAICYASAQKAAAVWKYGAIHEKKPYHDGTFKSWAPKRSDTHPFHFNDGVEISVSTFDLTPDDDFLASPPAFPSATDEGDRDGHHQRGTE